MENEQKLAGEKLEQVNGGYPAGADFEKGYVCLETLTCFFADKNLIRPQQCLNMRLSVRKTLQIKNNAEKLQ